VPLRTDPALSEMLERITPGLDEDGETLRRDRKFREAVEKLRRRYLEYEGASLIHGDLFPGSLLRTGAGELRVIDPEFSFCFDPEFDIGVFCAHLPLSRRSHLPVVCFHWMEEGGEVRSVAQSVIGFAPIVPRGFFGM
jgi:5-methylthioribose kinase